MKTIYAGLPFYGGVATADITDITKYVKREDYRVNSKIPFYTPTTHLPPFLVCDVIANLPATADLTLLPYDAITGGESITPTTPLQIIAKDEYFYIVHDGADLSAPLTPGRYWLIVEAGTEVYYSEVFSVVDMSTRRWCKIECSNTNDLGDILYATGGFESVYFLNTQLTYPASETVEIGEEKDGEFIAEKLVTKYVMRISDYVSRALHRCLMRLPQHDSITITDEVGNVYSPAVGNVQIEVDWPAFEVCHIVIKFNDGANTAFSWTYDMADII